MEHNSEIVEVYRLSKVKSRNGIKPICINLLIVGRRGHDEEEGTDKFHYLAITNLDRLLNHGRGYRTDHCPRCLIGFKRSYTKDDNENEENQKNQKKSKKINKKLESHLLDCEGFSSFNDKIWMKQGGDGKFITCSLFYNPT